MKKIISFTLTTLFFISCTNDPKEVGIVASKPHPGKALMELNCNACHSPTAEENARIAPPMIAIKKHYLKEGMTKEDFIADIQKWIKDPSESISKMPGAIKKFGVMAKVDYPKETIDQIADYLFSNEIEQPDWFNEHYIKKHGNNTLVSEEDKILTIKDIGMKYALSTKSQLGKNLMSAIQSEGVEHAVSFCNIQAMPITDSMSLVNNAHIKRVSDKARNPNNKANAVELAHITTFKNQLTNKEEMLPILEENGDKVNFYFPITTNAMCLQCHGTLKKELALSTYNKIKSLYPKDEAIGYSENQIRGIWSIEFNR